MSARLMILVIATMALAGCATTQSSQTNPLQNQVADLTQRMEQQEKEIVDLKYEVKAMGEKKESQEWAEAEKKSAVIAETSSSKADVKFAGSEDLIRVKASGTEVQKALKNAGVYEGKIDGKLGPKTKSAIAAFQKQHNLKADGVIGQKTWNELKQYLTEQQ